MLRIAEFEKVSFNAFKKSIEKAYKMDSSSTIMREYALYSSDDTLQRIYDNIKIPSRSTKRSAGYDFFYPFGETLLLPKESLIVPSGIKVRILENINFDFYLGIYTRSSLGFYNRIKQDDTVAIIDADYYNTGEEEGNIFIHLRNEHPNKTFKLKNGSKIAQGIFQIYGVTLSDNATEDRNGGLGSTTSI